VHGSVDASDGGFVDDESFGMKVSLGTVSNTAAVVSEALKPAWASEGARRDRSGSLGEEARLPPDDPRAQVSLHAIVRGSDIVAGGEEPH
jgi:hypothetical protein